MTDRPKMPLCQTKGLGIHWYPLSFLASGSIFLEMKAGSAGKYTPSGLFQKDHYTFMLLDKHHESQVSS
jgi:hypothetical protein